MLKIQILYIVLVLISFVRSNIANCPHSKWYRITNVNDLRTQFDEIDCIFEAGFTPINIGEGSYIPHPLWKMPSKFGRSVPLSRLSTDGEFVMKNKEKNIYHGSVLTASGLHPRDSVWAVETLTDKAAGLYDAALIIEDFAESNLGKADSFVAARIVGRTRNNEFIYLCKEYTNFNQKGEYTIVQYFALTNSDSRANIKFKPETPIYYKAVSHSTYVEPHKLYDDVMYSAVLSDIIKAIRPLMIDQRRLRQ